MLAVGSVAEIQRGETGMHTRTWVRVRVLGGAGGLTNWLAERRNDVPDLRTTANWPPLLMMARAGRTPICSAKWYRPGSGVAAFGSQTKSLEEVFMQVTEGLVQ